MSEVPVQPQSPVPPQTTQTPVQPQVQQTTQIPNPPQNQQEKKKGGLIGKVLLIILLVIVLFFTSVFAWLVLFGTGGSIGFELLGFPSDFGGFLRSIVIGIIFIPILTTINTVLTFKAIRFLKSEDVKHRSIGWVLLLIVIIIVLFPFAFLPL